MDSLTLTHFDTDNFAVETRSDLTPVTEADKKTGRVTRKQLGRVCGRDPVLGEELPTTECSSCQRVIDLIDGIKNFMRGVPVWATLVDLIEDGQCIVRLVSAPTLGRRQQVASGGGAWTGRSLSSARRLSIPSVDDLIRASMSYSSLSGWTQTKRPHGMLGLMQSCRRTRAHGDFWSYMPMAEGTVDLAAEPELELYDMTALVPAAIEAGGRSTFLDNESGPFGDNAMTTNSLLHDAALHHLSAEVD